METINQTIVPELQTFAKSNELGKYVFEALSSRERAAARSDIDAIFRELESGKQAELNYFKYLDVWKMLEDKKLGTLVYGRRGNPNRFVWNTNLKHLGRIALGLPPETLPEGKKKVVASEPEVSSNEPSTVTFVIPASVSKDEILALLNLGAQLTGKPLKQNNVNSKK